ncbi:hypothetical protein B0T14DRAFT_518545, partial [Immersiella caudata]
MSKLPLTSMKLMTRFVYTASMVFYLLQSGDPAMTRSRSLAIPSRVEPMHRLTEVCLPGAHLSGMDVEPRRKHKLLQRPHPCPPWPSEERAGAIPCPDSLSRLGKIGGWRSTCMRSV